MSKQALISEIDRIITRVRDSMDGYPFVCALASGPCKKQIECMVKRHIGEQYTMNDFLNKKLRVWPTPRQANEYRLLMLDNMKKMVEAGEYA